MITSNQRSEIRNYLLSKNLPIDILMEVEDHFVSQINDLVREKNLNFQEAFEKVKLTWKPELRMVYNPNYSLDDISILMKKILTKRSISLFKQTAKTILLIVTILALFSYILELEAFYYVFLVTSVVVLIFPIVQYYQYRKDFKLIKKYDNYKLTLYQNYSNISIISGGFFVPFFLHIKILSTSIYSIFHLSADSFNFIMPTLYLFMLAINIFCFLSQRNYLRQIKKVKPFLPYLKPSS